MADISKCTGKNCPLAKSCYRYTAEASQYRQSYLCVPPLENGQCEYYWKNDEDANEEASDQDEV